MTYLTVTDIGTINSPEALQLANGDNGTALNTDGTQEGGVRVAVTDGDINPETGTGRQQIVSSRGKGYQPRIHQYSVEPPGETNNFLGFEIGFDGGVFVG
jgi:hypothetical protein